MDNTTFPFQQLHTIFRFIAFVLTRPCVDFVSLVPSPFHSFDYSAWVNFHWPSELEGIESAQQPATTLAAPFLVHFMNADISYECTSEKELFANNTQIGWKQRFDVFARTAQPSTFYSSHTAVFVPLLSSNSTEESVFVFNSEVLVSAMTWQQFVCFNIHCVQGFCFRQNWILSKQVLQINHGQYPETNTPETSSDIHLGEWKSCVWQRKWAKQLQLDEQGTCSDQRLWARRRYPGHFFIKFALAYKLLHLSEVEYSWASEDDPSLGGRCLVNTKTNIQAMPFEEWTQASIMSSRWPGSFIAKTINKTKREFVKRALKTRRPSATPVVLLCMNTNDKPS